MDPPDTPSPAPRLRRSPARQALHERSPSQTNEVLRPTIRLVPNEDDVKVYTTSPFPANHSQILIPSSSQSRAYVPPPPVPGANLAASTPLTQPVTSAPLPIPINLPPTRRSRSSQYYGSIADTLAGADSSFNSSSTPVTPQSTAGERYTPASSAPSDLDVDRRLEMESGPSRAYENRDDNEQQQQQQQYSTPSEAASYYSSSDPPSSDRPKQYARPSAPTPSRTAGPVNTPGTGASLGALASRASRLAAPSDQDTPLSTASAESSGTVIRNRASQVATPAGYYRLFPPPSRQPGSGRSGRSNSDPERPLSMEGEISPPSSGSPGSPVSPMSPPPSGPVRHSIYSSAAHARSDSALGTVGSDSTEQDVQRSIPRRPVGSRRNTDSNRWTLALSTVLSEGTVEDRSSSASRRGTNPHASTSSSFYGEIPPLPTQETAEARQERLSRQQVPAGGHIRAISDTTDKDLPPLPENHGYGPQPPPPPQAHVRSDQRTSQLRNEPGNRDSGTSFTTREFRDTMPVWARSYYAHEARNRATIGTGARPTSQAPPKTQSRAHRHTTIGSPLAPPQRSLLRVSNPRPGRADRASFYRDSLAITPISDQPTYADRQSFPAEVRGSRLDLQGETDWSPHLFYDRRSAVNRRTLWVEPSIDLSAEGKGATRRNVQVWFFVAGFIMPLAWIIASFLPLPPKVRSPPTTPGFERDIEKAFGPRDLARYENARWWRNVNRMMSVVGWLIIIALVVLVVVAATRPQDLAVS